MSIWERRKRLWEGVVSIHKHDGPSFSINSIQRGHTIVVSWRRPRRGEHPHVIV